MVISVDTAGFTGIFLSIILLSSKTDSADEFKQHNADNAQHEKEDGLSALLKTNISMNTTRVFALAQTRMIFKKKN